MEEKILILSGWDEARRRVKKGLERLGHDIPIVGYGHADEIKMGRRKADGSKKNIEKQAEDR